MKGRFCLTNLLECLEVWANEMVRGVQVDVVYTSIDLQKAFYTVPTERILLRSKRLVSLDLY